MSDDDELEANLAAEAEFAEESRAHHGPADMDIAPAPAPAAAPARAQRRISQESESESEEEAEAVAEEETEEEEIRDPRQKLKSLLSAPPSYIVEPHDLQELTGESASPESLPTHAQMRDAERDAELQARSVDAKDKAAARRLEQSAVEREMAVAEVRVQTDVIDPRSTQH